MIESCREYYGRLLNEGWIPIKETELDAILYKDGLFKHVYLWADTHTYKIDNIVTQAYKGRSSSTTGFDSVSNEFTSSEYNKVKVDDDNHASYDTSGYYYALMRLDVSIQENISDISQIDILVRGYGVYSYYQRYVFYLYVKESGTWISKGSHAYRYKSTLSTSYTSGFSSIIANGILKYGVRTGKGDSSYGSVLLLYYGQVVVTYTSVTLPTVTTSSVTNIGLD